MCPSGLVKDTRYPAEKQTNKKTLLPKLLLGRHLCHVLTNGDFATMIDLKAVLLHSGSSLSSHHGGYTEAAVVL